MHQPDEVDGVTFNLVADVVGKRAAVLAGETVWADMITDFPSDDGPHSVLEPFVKVPAESVGNRKKAPLWRM